MLTADRRCHFLDFDVVDGHMTLPRLASEEEYVAAAAAIGDVVSGDR